MQFGLATRLVVSPATPEDWTVLRLNRRQVEREVLDQVDSLYHPISLERGQTHELKCASIHITHKRHQLLKVRVVTVGQLLQLTVGQVRTLEQRSPCVLWVLNSGTL